jgi:hypothetical protein
LSNSITKENGEVFALCVRVRDLFGEMSPLAQVITVGSGIPGNTPLTSEPDNDRIRDEVRRRLSKPNANVVIYREDTWEAPVLPAASSWETLSGVIKQRMPEIYSKIKTAIDPVRVSVEDTDCLWFATGKAGSVYTGLVVFIAQKQSKNNLFQSLASTPFISNLCCNSMFLELFVYGICGLILGTLIGVLSGQTAWLLITVLLVPLLLMALPRVWLWLKPDMKIYFLLVTGGTILLWNLLRDLFQHNLIRAMYVGNAPQRYILFYQGQEIPPAKDPESVIFRASFLRNSILIEGLLILLLVMRIK